MEDMNRLVELVKEMGEMDKDTMARFSYEASDGYMYWRGENCISEGDIWEHVDEVDFLCCGLFIRKDGTPNRRNIDIFMDMLPGVAVGPGESDSFGWLSGVLRYDGMPRFCFG